MQVKTHALPERFAMLGGLAADPGRGCLWAGMAGIPKFVWRFELDGSRFVEEPTGNLLDGYSYIHRSIVPAPDGNVYVGATWILGIKPGKGRPQPFSPKGFGWAIATIRWLGGFLATCRIIRRDSSGAWSVYYDEDSTSMDLTWDPREGRLLRSCPSGVYSSRDGNESCVASSQGGFIHELNIGPRGELLISDTEGALWLQETGDRPTWLGRLEDADAEQNAAPGIDGVVAAGSRWMVGGTRNRARPFIVDFESRAFHLLDPLPTAPRASALAVTADGKIYLAAGVGKVGLYRIDPEARQVEDLGRISAGGVDCHHLHDLVALPDGRLFGGEFFPLDVPYPPWPPRSCLLWEIEL